MRPDPGTGSHLFDRPRGGLLSGRQFDQAKKATDPEAFDSAKRTGKTQALVADVLTSRSPRASST